MALNMTSCYPCGHEARMRLRRAVLVLCFLQLVVVTNSLPGAAPAVASALSFQLSPLGTKRCFAFDFEGTEPTAVVRFRVRPGASRETFQTGNLVTGVRVAAHKPTTQAAVGNTGGVEATSQVYFDSVLTKGELFPTTPDGKLDLDNSNEATVTLRPYAYMKSHGRGATATGEEVERYLEGTYLCCFSQEGGNVVNEPDSGFIIELDEITAKNRRIREEEARMKQKLIALRRSLPQEVSVEQGTRLAEDLVAMNEMQHSLLNILDQAVYMCGREGRMRQTSESTFTRMCISIVVSILAVIVSSWLTLAHTKHVLVKKKLV